jgi:hypothetical protein
MVLKQQRVHFSDTLPIRVLAVSLGYRTTANGTIAFQNQF